MGWTRQIEMPDAGASDYLAPAVHPGADLSGLDGEALWNAIRIVLPPADILNITGLRTWLDGQVNPLAAHRLCQLSRTRGSDVLFSDSWEAYIQSLSARTQKDLRACRRRFEKAPGARVAYARDVATAEAWLDALDAMQAERLNEKGVVTSITKPEFSELYRLAARRGIETGEVLMAGLFAGDKPLALAYALRDGDRAVYVRVGALQDEWAPMRLGILVSETIMKQAHEAGVRKFDFGLGDYDYKRRLGARPVGLVDLDLPLSARGLLPAGFRFVKRKLREIEFLRRLTGRAPLPAQG